MKQLIQQIEQWAEDRNLIKGSTPQKQMLKLMEEFGELCNGYNKNKDDIIKDSIGDCTVVLVILAHQLKGDLTKEKILKEIVECAGYPLPIQRNDEFARAKIIDTTKRLGWIADGILSDEEKIARHYAILAVEDLAIIAAYLGLAYKDCVQSAYNQIKDRKGKMIDGVFVKEEDLCPKPSA